MRFTTIGVRRFRYFLLTLTLLTSFAHLASGATTISTSPVADTTWSVAGSPYTLTANITVPAGVTLTIDPGVQVLADLSGALDIDGVLVAQGTAALPISFARSGATGKWKGLSVTGTAAAPGAASLAYVTVSDGGGSSCTYCAGLYVENSTSVTVAKSAFTNSGTSGIYAYSGSVDVSDSSFTNNALYAIRYDSAASNPLLARLTATGNGTDAVSTGGGTMTGAHVWEAMGLPYMIAGSQTLATGGSLTIAPGVEVRFGSGTSLTLNGALTAVATPATPITLTGSTATAGSWGGVKVVNGSATIDSVNISYGGNCTYCADLYVENSIAQVTRSSFSSSLTSGIYVYSGNANVSQSSFANNTLYAIRYEQAASNPVLASLTATGNGNDAIAIGGGTMTGAHVWEASGISSYVILGSQTLGTGATLTIAPGVQVGFGSGLVLNVLGTLSAVGTAAAPISLTGTTAGAGSWQGVKVYGSATFDFVTFGGGGNCTYCADLYVEGAAAQAQVTRSAFSASATDGIYVYSGIANVSNSSFANNTRYAIKYESASANPALANLTATANGINAVAFGSGTMSGAHVWQAAGLPYVVTASETVAAGSSLTIDPGVQVMFAANTLLTVNGLLRASGSAALPISLTGVVPSAGSWQGLKVGYAASAPASVTLDYVTLAHGGGGGCVYCADLYIEYGRAQITHSTIRDSLKDGVWQYYGSGSSIESSQIVGNAGYGVNNEQTKSSYALQATNNWWGAASGPTSTCVTGGSGSATRGAVAVVPFLTAPDADPGLVAPGDLAMLSITPQRWFAPADNITRLFVKVTIRNGNGQPLPGRVIRLSSTIGSVVDGGTTDVNGSTFAYVSSSIPGDATLIASTDVETLCVFSRSQPSTVTFTAVDSNPLRPDIEAPYLDGGIQISPEPITRGVLTTISAKLNNRNAYAISVDATIGFAQSGIGLTFGPLGEIVGKIIPANSEGTISVQWTPVVSGHYCMQLQYSAVAVASNPLVRTSSVTVLSGGSGRSQRNLNVYGGGLGDKNEKDSLNKADKAFKLVSKLPSGPTQVQKFVIGRWWGWVKKTASEISENLGGDPPRLDYKTIALPDPKPVLSTATPDSDVSAARIAAMNALNDALLDVVVQGRAAVISLDRAGGAAQASNLLWNSQQTAALLQYKKTLGNAFILAADKTDAFLLVLANEGVTTVPTTLADVQAYQARLNTQGFTAGEINDAHAFGYTDADIAAALQGIVSADPATLTGDMIPRLVYESATMRAAGNALIYPQNFPSYSVSGGSIGHPARASAAALTTNHLARIFPSVSTIEVGNPTAAPATIDLLARVVDLPADWTVVLSPSSLTLNAGEQATVTVTVTPGAPVPQGITPRIAVEAYIGTNLLGGVAVDVIVPTAVPFRLSIGGDANGDGAVTVGDIFYEINHLFAGGPAPVAGDANGDGVVTVADIFYTINYLFTGGPSPI